MAKLSDEARALFQGANYGHLATVLPDGSPHSVPVWVDVQDDRVCFFTQPGTRKARNVEHDPRVAISIADHEDPYKMALVRGRVVEVVEGERALAAMDRMALRYTGAPFPLRTGVLFVVEPESVFGMKLPFEHRPQN